MRINCPQRDKGGTCSTLNLEKSIRALGEASSIEMIEQRKINTK